jgi:hypothetical protein
MALAAVVHDSYLVCNGIHYFRGRAETVHIGAYGEKKTPILSADYLAVQHDLPVEEMRVHSATIVDLDFTKSLEADVTTNLKVADTGAIGAAAYRDLKAGKLKLVRLEMQLGALLAVNGLPTVLAKLKSYGDDARVCHEVFVVVSAALAQTITAGGELEFERAGTTFTMSVRNTRNSTVTFSAGTTFGYRLAGPGWERGKERIEKFIDDLHGAS